MTRTQLDSIILPCKFQLLKGMIFRRSHPAVCGIEILGGVLKQNATIINSTGKEVGIVKQLQDKNQTIRSAVSGLQVAVSMNEPVIGRTISEGEILYTLPTAIGARLLNQKYRESLSDSDFDILQEILNIRRKIVPLYGF